MKAVFDTKAGSRYDDEATSRYHFPKSPYLATVTATIGDWIIYREPRENGGSMAYFGAAQVNDVVDDPRDPSHAYALMANYLPFDRPVPFSSQRRYEERPLRELTHRAGVGAALRGRSARLLADEDFAAITLKGLSTTLAPTNAKWLHLEATETGLAKEAAAAIEPAEQARLVAQLLINRKIRDASFRQAVLTAYDNTCAVTGLRIINGGGRAEAQAAHIVPVAQNGLDIVQNGIALCGTAHWLFDRHLISIGEDRRLLIAHNQLPEQLRNLFLPAGNMLHLPKDERLWPALRFLDHHRERFASAH